MYNSWSAVDTPKSSKEYWTNMTTQEIVFKGSYTKYTIEFDSSNFIVGFPATKSAAGSGYNEPNTIINDFLKPLKAKGIRGVMTWDIGWDIQNNSNFGTTIGNYLGL